MCRYVSFVYVSVDRLMPIDLNITLFKAGTLVAVIKTPLRLYPSTLCTLTFGGGLTWH